jgi:nitrite reductase/ring-hydroxylating ferredoxin subunit
MSSSSDDLPRKYPDGLPEEMQPQWRLDFPIVIPDDDGIARREFTKFLVLTSGAFVAGQCWIAAMAALRGRGPWPEKRIAALDEIPASGVLEFEYPEHGERCLLLMLDDGELVAFGQECTHLACAVVPRLEDRQLHCPCHNGFFDARDGRPLAGPPRRPLPRITLAVRDGDVFATGVELRTV